MLPSAAVGLLFLSAGTMHSPVLVAVGRSSLAAARLGQAGGQVVGVLHQGTRVHGFRVITFQDCVRAAERGMGRSVGCGTRVKREEPWGLWAVCILAGVLKSSAARQDLPLECVGTHYLRFRGRLIWVAKQGRSPANGRAACTEGVLHMSGDGATGRVGRRASVRHTLRSYC